MADPPIKTSSGGSYRQFGTCTLKGRRGVCAYGGISCDVDHLSLAQKALDEEGDTVLRDVAWLALQAVRFYR